jgi:hypothetical protein
VVGDDAPVVVATSADPTDVDPAVAPVGVVLLAGVVGAGSLSDEAVVASVSVVHPAATVSHAVSSTADRHRGIDMISRSISFARHSLPSRQVRAAA